MSRSSMPVAQPHTATPVAVSDTVTVRLGIVNQCAGGGE
jgi:hypothetical protein